MKDGVPQSITTKIVIPTDGWHAGLTSGIMSLDLKFSHHVYLCMSFLSCFTFFLTTAALFYNVPPVSVLHAARSATGLSQSEVGIYTDICRAMLLVVEYHIGMEF